MNLEGALSCSCNNLEGALFGRMACQAIRYWTISGLIGAFLDLGIASVLLCCSTAAFFISKFLGFFGFPLPCPCNGLFSKPSPDHCLQRLLVDSPTKKISAVQTSIRSKFHPFDSVGNRYEDYQLSFKVVREKKQEGVIELEGEASCSSVSVSKRSQIATGVDTLCKNEGLAAKKEGRFGVKRKGSARRQRDDLRRWRRSSMDHIKLPPNSLYDNVRSGATVVPLYKCGNSNTGNEIASDNCTTHDIVENVMELDHKSFGSNVPTDTNEVIDKDMVPLGSQRSDTGKHLLNDGHLENAIRILEQALEEERAARNALLYDLEKERNAAATAADEAMAMILRLQDEKAALKLEARQYERMLEEKSTYDAEEIDVLKEIIVRREKEKYSLEREVESYRKMLEGTEQLEGDADDVTDL